MVRVGPAIQQLGVIPDRCASLLFHRRKGLDECLLIFSHKLHPALRNRLGHVAHCTFEHFGGCRLPHGVPGKVRQHSQLGLQQLFQLREVNVRGGDHRKLEGDSLRGAVAPRHIHRDRHSETCIGLLGITRLLRLNPWIEGCRSGVDADVTDAAHES